MFEQAVLDSTYSGRRAFTAGMGFAFQSLLALCLILAPLIWPQVLPNAQFSMTIGPPRPDPKPPEQTTAIKPRTTRAPAPIFRADLLIPQHVPAHPQIVTDPPAAARAPLNRPPLPHDTPQHGPAHPHIDPAPPAAAGDSFIGLPGGIDSGAPRGNPILDSLLQAIPGPVPVEKPKPATPAASEEPKRVRASSLDPGKLIRKVEPQYPQIARTARIEGTVELRAVVGIDGRIRDLTVLSGHPLLRKAAIDAVSQWIYQPPVLNGEKVEIVAPISVIFRLGQ